MIDREPALPDQQTPFEEQRLIHRLQQGDREAFDSLFRRYMTTVYRQALRLLGREEEAEEVVQEVFLTLYEKANTFRGQAALATWLYRLTTNAAISRLRRRQRHVEVGFDDYLPQFEAGHHAAHPVVDWSIPFEERLLQAERERLLHEALDNLRPLDKAVVVLSDLEGFTNRDVAHLLEISIPAVKSRLHRARLSLRGKLAETLEQISESQSNKE